MVKIEELMNKLGYGRKNAKTRSLLAAELCSTDREVREAINKARSEGNIIVNNQDGVGYYLLDETNLDEVYKWYLQEHKRAMNTLIPLSNTRKLLKANGYKV